MKLFWQIIYNTLGLGLFYVGLGLGFLFNEKIRRGIKGRKGLWLNLKKNLTPAQWIWFHISSMGEFEQAKPIISRLKEKRSDFKILVTFFSPSGYDSAINYKEANLISYLPFDTPWNAKKMLKLISPILLIFIKYDLWPNLVWQAKKMNIPMLLADGSLSHTKLNFLTKLFYQQIYQELTTICTILKEDESIFKTIVSPQTNILVTGDTRYDQVYQRLLKVKKEGFMSREFLPKGVKIIVAGSTWQKDEEVILNSYKNLISEFKDLILILVPHEPTSDRLKQIDDIASKLDLVSVRWSTMEARKQAFLPHTFEDFDKKSSNLSTTSKFGISYTSKSKTGLIIVDKVGILANLYQLGDLTYVGGGFGHGVHNCLEPAVMGKPVFLGPKINNSKEAKLLVERNAGFVVTNSQEMTTKMTQLLSNQEMLIKSSQTAFELVKENLGATEKIVLEIEKEVKSVQGVMKGKEEI